MSALLFTPDFRSRNRVHLSAALQQIANTRDSEQKRTRRFPSSVDADKRISLTFADMFYARWEMDIELARTFVEIVSTGSFIKAAENLHVAQTTVSARMRLLEQQLRCPLFVRSKAGATLTPAGEQFLRYAPTFVQLWRRAQQQVAVPEGHRVVMTVGSEVSLWSPLLVEWVKSMRRSHPDIALRIHVDVPQDLIAHVATGFVDIAVVHTPQHRPGLTINLLTEEELVLVTTNPKTNRARDLQYVHVEWSADFSQRCAESFPDKTLNLVSNLGPLALDYILSEGGSGYFRMNVVKPYLESGALHLVAGAPCFSFPIYIVHSVNVDANVLDLALTTLRTTLNLELKSGFTRIGKSATTIQKRAIRRSR